MNDAHPDLARQLAPAPRRAAGISDPLALLIFVVIVGSLAAIGAWHILRWLTLAAVAFAQSHGL